VAEYRLHDPDVIPECTTRERYCLESGLPVGPIPGDRCIAHGASDTPCMTGLRAPQCRHERQSPNHPYPHCAECGADAPPAADIEKVRALRG
jgi:hypothetical protein